MTDPSLHFEQTKKSIRFGRKAIDELEQIVGDWFGQRPYYRTVEEYPLIGQMVVKYVRNRRFPEAVEDKVTHAIVTLRHAFDQMAWAAVRYHNPRLRANDSVYFPWTDTIDGFEKRLAGKSCKIPAKLTPVFLAAKPYGTGDGHATADDICRSLSKVANRKHSVGIVPAFIPGALAMPDFMTTRPGRVGFLPKQGWQAMENECVVMTMPLGTIISNQEQICFYVAFNETPPMDGENVISCLRAFLAKAESSLEIIERETLALIRE
ncbi:hypothetical protein GCM10009069_22600 [Algimonas arctica]|uniref:Uncharacterized protein n=1 Tax=Algimonas arctica TaxID=1479486 RepID=A0A8J3CTF9_9PROT|nr:hypothetical protein [Algimonas arctica]GHA99102.1 hypothetical protein GCM10009069_22600 [Algimonas arctica]